MLNSFRNFCCALSLFTAILIFPSHSKAENTVSVSPQDLAGLYWRDHKIGFVGDDEEYQVSDALEIVPFSADAFYIRTKLLFSNGHNCAYSGVAEREGNGFTAYDSTVGKLCIMDITSSKNEILFNDRLGTCSQISCGARGGYNKARFSRIKRKPISYMDKLKASPQYINAEKLYKIRLSAKAAGISPEWAGAKAFLAKYAFWGNVEGVQQSLDQGADPNELPTEKNEWVPLQAAAYSRNIEITQMMLDHGLSINAVQDGETLYTKAAQNGPAHRRKIDETVLYLQWLLDNGIDPNIRNSSGQTALEIAIKSNSDKRIIDLLEKNTAPKN